jgi:hypothetical protein
MPGSEEFADRYAGQPADLDVEVPLHDGPDTHGIDPEASREANLRAVDEAHWLAMEERLGAERDNPIRYAGQRVELMTPEAIEEGMRAARRIGPGYVAHLMDLSGSGPHACDGRPFDPIPDAGGTVVYACTGCYVVGPKLVEERKMANLGNATTRNLLAELKARGEFANTNDGRYLARLAGNLLAGNSALGAEMLDYRTVDGRDA